MGCPQVVGSFPFTLYVAGTQPAWLPLGPSLLVPGADTLDMVVKVTRITGDAEVSAGVQLFATRTNEASADPAAAAGGYTSTNGDAKHYTYDLSAATSSFYAQPGVLAKVDPSTPGFVQGTLSVVLGSCGRLVGQREIEAFLFEEATRAWQFTIGGWNAALNASKARATLIGTNVSDVDWRLYARLANDPDEAGVLAALGTGFTSFSPTNGNVEVNTGDLDLTGLSLSDYQLIQLILALRMTSMGDNPKAFLKVAAAMSYA